MSLTAYIHCGSSLTISHLQLCCTEYQAFVEQLSSRKKKMAGLYNQSMFATKPRL